MPSDDQIEHIERTFGSGYLETPTPVEQRITHLYLNKGIKQIVERPLGLALNLALSRQGERWAEQISEEYGGPGYFTLQAGFSPENMHSLVKIQTMREGADGEFASPFQHAAFSDFKELDDDPRILSDSAQWLRGWRNEIPQLSMVARGDMFFIGIRSYSVEELKGNNIILWLSKNSDLLKFQAGVGEIYEEFIRLTKNSNMHPGLIGVHSALDPKKTTNTVRLLLNNQYLKGKASPLMDMRVFYNVVQKRLLERF